jgi:hypothetical protein
MSECPSPDVLDRLLAEALDVNELAAVETHIEA